MRFASLGSGSEGNALLVEAGATRVLVDCGFGLRDTCVRLERLGVAPDSLTAIVVTHEHGDHVGGVGKLASKFQIPVWASYGTLNAASQLARALPRLEPFDSHTLLEIGDLQVLPFAVPHDAREPTQLVFSDGRSRLGVLTDLGHITPCVRDALSACDALVLECNHDETMLANGPYPYQLKQRVAGDYGHLSNRQAAALLTEIDVSRLRHLVASHISQTNNRVELAVDALASVLGCEASWVGVADQALGFEWRSLA